MVATTRRYTEQRGLYGRRRCPTHPQGQARAQWATNMEASLAFVSFYRPKSLAYFFIVIDFVDHFPTKSPQTIMASIFTLFNPGGGADLAPSSLIKEKNSFLNS